MDDKQSRAVVRQRMVDDMLSLMRRRPDEGLSWASTKTDLIEMVHLLYISEVMRDRNNLPMTFKELVRRACAIVHVSEPRNPNQLVARARLRKGLRMLPLEERYDGLRIVHSEAECSKSYVCFHKTRFFQVPI